MPWGRLWVSEHTTVLAGARVRLLGLLQVFGSNVLPFSKQDKIDGSVFARVKLVYFELLYAPIGQEHREHVAIMCWGPTRTKFDEILVGGDPVREQQRELAPCFADPPFDRSPRGEGTDVLGPRRAE